MELNFGDARHLQIGVLSSLLVYGYAVLGFDITLARIVLIITTALLTQWLCSRWVGLSFFEPRSALISSLSLCLLLRTDSWYLAILVVVATILSKFLLRCRGKHIFNPTNFGLAVGVLFFDGIWVSPGQWGNAAVAVTFFVCAGLFVVVRSLRSDVTLGFLLFFGASLMARSYWLGDPIEIPLHQLSSGALLLFSFFMISDPRATPDSRKGRLIFSALVAVTAYYIRFSLFNPDALILALFFISALTPLIDLVLHGPRFEWRYTFGGGPREEATVLIRS